MLKLTGAVLMLSLAPYIQCLDSDDDRPCTMIFVYGVNVEVTNQAGAPIANATCTLQDGNYIEVMQTVTAGEYFGAGEREGTYTLTVEAPGYQSRTVQNIVVGADECHVIPVTVKVPMTAQ